MAKFLLGYNIESCSRRRPEALPLFLKAAARLHKDLCLPCTVFLCGRSLEEAPGAFAQFRDSCGDLVDFQQYTYAALPLKTVSQTNRQGTTVFRGLGMDEARESIARTAELMTHHLNIRPVGLGAPLGYYRGFSDRPLLLETLNDLGIRFVRSYTRNAEDWSPLAFEVQPFAYEPQGFPDILEIPGQGWPDTVLRRILGFENVDRCVEHVKKDLDYVAAKGLVWSYVAHDWACVESDPEMRGMRAILEHAQARGFQVQTHAAFARALQGEIRGADVTAFFSEEALSEPDRTVRVSVPGSGLGRARRCGWRTPRMYLLGKAVKHHRKPQLRRLMRKAGSVARRRWLKALGRCGTRPEGCG